MEVTKSNFSFIGIGIGAVAFLLALVHFWAGPFSPQPTLEEFVGHKAAGIKKATIAALQGHEAEAPKEKWSMNADGAANLATAVLGGLAIVLAVLGYARHEPMRAAGGAAALGGGAIAFQFVVIAVGAIVVAILISAALSQLGG